MSQLHLLSSAAIAGVLGVASHVFYFIKGEHHLQAYRLLQLSITTPAVLFAFLLLRFNVSVVSAATVVITTWCAYMASLWTSMVVYRLYFHRLRAFDGPTLWKISKVFGHVMSVRKLDNFRVLDKLHRQYGDYVRTGPMDLSIIDPDIADTVYGSRSRCAKGIFYDSNFPLTTVQEMRDKDLHDKRRRRAWDPGFSMKSLRNYESRVVRCADELITQLSTFSGKAVNVSAWVSYFGFEVMGELAFGKSFDMLKRGKNHWAIDILHENVKLAGILTPASWLINMIKPIPFLPRDIQRFEKYSEEAIEERKKIVPAEPDIMSHMLEAEPLYPDQEMERLLLVGDSKLAIIAGSDTTSTTLAFAFYHLARDPSEAAKLREELSSVPMDEGFSVHALQDLKHLNAFVMETLRLHPAVPGGVYRTTPPEGLQVGEHYIPGNVQILTPTWSLHRSPKAYELPTSFIPERWYSQPELIKTRPPVFLTFGGSSTYSCIGKNLAMMEMKTVIAKMVTRFDIRFAPGEDGKKLLEDSKDVFVTEIADLFLEFRDKK